MLFHLRKHVRMPKPYVFASIVVSIGGLLFGLDTGVIGPVTTMEQFVRQNGSFGALVHGLIVSSILIPAALASFLAGPLADRAGRTYGIMLGSCIFALGTAIEAAAQNLGMFIGGRVVTGVGEGLFLSTVTVYVCEIVPSASRGALASICQMGTTTGICVGYFICYGTTRIPSSFSWRIPFIFQSFLAVLLAVSCPFLPPSPRFLISKGRTAELPATLARLGLSPEEFAEETRTPMPLGSTLSTQQRRRPLSSLRALLAPHARRQALFAVFLTSMQQFAGIDGVLYYAPTLFAAAGLPSPTSAFLASGISALVIFLVTIPACLAADRFSRRASTLTGALGMSTTMFLVGALYAYFSTRPAHALADSPARWVVIVAIFAYAVSYCTTWAVALRIYVAEIQPSETRAAAAALAQSANWIGNFAVALTTPVLLARSSYAAYFLWGGCAAITGVVCWAFMPETRGRPLDGIDGFVVAVGPKEGVVHVETPLEQVAEQGRMEEVKG